MGITPRVQLLAPKKSEDCTKSDFYAIVAPFLRRQLHGCLLRLKRCVIFLIKNVENYTKLHFCVIFEDFEAKNYTPGLKGRREKDRLSH